MLIWILTAALLSAVTGVVLTLLGLRGRRIDQSPICRRCGFDLKGRFPWAEPTCPTCPDCGEQLLSYESVRNGARARRPRLLAVGLMLCFPGLILLLAGAADTLAGGATATIKTSQMLANQVSGDTKGSVSLKVLTGRVASGGASGYDIQPAIDRALALQANRASEIDPQWIELLEAARRRGQLNPQQIQRYFENAIDWRLFAVSTDTHSPVPFAVQAYADRLGTVPKDTPLFLSIESNEVSLDGRGLRFGLTLDAYSSPPRSSMLTQGTLIEVVDTAGHDAEAGAKLPLAMSWIAEVRKGAANGPILATWTQRLNTAADVHPRARRDEAGGTKALTTLATLTSALKFESVQLERDATGACWASFSIRPSALTHDVVAMLRITTADGQVYESLSPVTITPSDPRWPVRMAADPGISPWSARVQMNGSPGSGKAQVDLVPYPGPRQHALAPAIWTGDAIRLDGVELRWSELPVR